MKHEGVSTAAVCKVIKHEDTRRDTTSYSKPTAPFNLGRAPHEGSPYFPLPQTYFRLKREGRYAYTTHARVRVLPLPEAVLRAEVVAGARTVVIGVTKADAFATRHASAIAPAAMICLKAILSVCFFLSRLRVCAVRVGNERKKCVRGLFSRAYASLCFFV